MKRAVATVFLIGSIALAVNSAGWGWNGEAWTPMSRTEMIRRGRLMVDLVWKPAVGFANRDGWADLPFQVW